MHIQPPSLQIRVVFVVFCGLFWGWACHKDRQPLMPEYPVSPPHEADYFRFWLNDSPLAVQAYRVRKADGASRMRLVANFPDSLRFSLFATPFLTGVQPIGSGNVAEVAVKYARTHCDFYQHTDTQILRFYDTNPTKAQSSVLEIIAIDSIERIVTARFWVHMLSVADLGAPALNQIVLRGEFRSKYQE
jgi:hypothetical protein